jgi:hypothetical protein
VPGGNSAWATKPGSQAQVTVMGKIQSSGKDASGKPSLRVVDPRNGTSFQLAPNDKAKELGKHVGEIATLSGAITSDGKGQRVLRVERYRLEKS